MMKEKTKGILILLLVYLIAFGLGFWVSSVSDYGLLQKSAVATAMVVCIIFLGSIDFNNSSIFDPYWSVVPPLMILYYALMFQFPQVADAGPSTIQATQWSLVTGNQYHVSGSHTASRCAMFLSPRFIIMFLLVLLYSIRLTWNFLRFWPGLSHEDWRYVDFRKKSGKAYWIVSFFAIHLFPALMVFGGTLSIWVTVTHAVNPFNYIDGIAILVTGSAILLEAIADRQLRSFISQNQSAGKTMDQGLWSMSRHPNYLGEILFWWGLYLFALAANPQYWWVIAGPLAITLMFLSASIPMIEKRLLERKTGYHEYRKKVPLLIPWKILKRRPS